MRHTFQPQAVKWHGSSIQDWPFADRSTQMETSYSIDQRVPAIRLCPGRAGAANCKAVVTVEGTVPELGEDIDGDSVVLGLALNGQQYVDVVTPIFQTMESISSIEPPLGPVRITEVTSEENFFPGVTPINIHPLDYTGGAAEVVAAFTRGERPEALTVLEHKYFMMCTLAATIPASFLCLTPPSVPPGDYQVHVALNAAQFDATGSTYLYYEPPTLQTFLPLDGVSFGGVEVTLTGSGFIKTPLQNLIHCRWGDRCLSGDANCASNANSEDKELAVDEGVVVLSAGVFVSTNSIKCTSLSSPARLMESLREQ